jgi:hypothetical protein
VPGSTHRTYPNPAPAIHGTAAASTAIVTLRRVAWRAIAETAIVALSAATRLTESTPPTGAQWRNGLSSCA